MSLYARGLAKQHSVPCSHTPCLYGICEVWHFQKLLGDCRDRRHQMGMETRDREARAQNNVLTSHSLFHPTQQPGSLSSTQSPDSHSPTSPESWIHRPLRCTQPPRPIEHWGSQDSKARSTPVCMGPQLLCILATLTSSGRLILSYAEVI